MKRWKTRLVWICLVPLVVMVVGGVATNSVWEFLAPTVKRLAATASTWKHGKGRDMPTNTDGGTQPQGTNEKPPTGSEKREQLPTVQSGESDTKGAQAPGSDTTATPPKDKPVGEQTSNPPNSSGSTPSPQPTPDSPYIIAITGVSVEPGKEFDPVYVVYGRNGNQIWTAQRQAEVLPSYAGRVDNYTFIAGNRTTWGLIQIKTGDIIAVTEVKVSPGLNDPGTPGRPAAKLLAFDMQATLGGPNIMRCLVTDEGENMAWHPEGFPTFAVEPAELGTFDGMWFTPSRLGTGTITITSGKLQKTINVTVVEKRSFTR